MWLLVSKFICYDIDYIYSFRKCFMFSGIVLSQSILYSPIFFFHLVSKLHELCAIFMFVCEVSKKRFDKIGWITRCLDLYGRTGVTLPHTLGTSNCVSSVISAANSFMRVDCTASAWSISTSWPSELFRTSFLDDIFLLRERKTIKLGREKV